MEKCEQKICADIFFKYVVCPPQTPLLSTFHVSSVLGLCLFKIGRLNRGFVSNCWNVDDPWVPIPFLCVCMCVCMRGYWVRRWVDGWGTFFTRNCPSFCFCKRCLVLFWGVAKKSDVKRKKREKDKFFYSVFSISSVIILSGALRKLPSPLGFRGSLTQCR